MTRAALLTRLVAVLGPLAACSSTEEPRADVPTSGPVASATAASPPPTAPPPETAAPPPTSTAAPAAGPAWRGASGIDCVHEGHTRGNDAGVGRCKYDVDSAAAELHVSGMHGFSFDEPATKAERAKVADACCYRVIRPRLGRPLLDADARPIVAAAIGAGGWADAPASPAAPPEARAAWARDAALEHASVGAFARLALSLLSLGAPASLVAAAHAAALDEIRHARLCYGLASAAGTAVGPDALDVASRAPLAGGLAALALEALREGCVGETLAALEAARAAELAADRAARDGLAEVARDEARHAELAFAIVRWAIDRGDAGARRAIADEAARLARAPLAPEEGAPRPAGLSAWGRLSPDEHRETLEAGLAEVVRPALRAVAARASA